MDAARTAGIDTVAPIVGPNDPNEPKLGERVFATNPYYSLERGEALYGKAIAFDVSPKFFLTGGSGPGYQKFIVQAIQWATNTACALPCCFLFTLGPSTPLARQPPGRI